jgi:very-short-patch-repair endonuclease
VLWKAIRSGQLGVPFRRQVPLGRYIADFVAPRARLIVEVDGGAHRFKQAADTRRDRKLARLSYTVLRLEAQLVITTLQFALQRVHEALRKPG